MHFNFRSIILMVLFISNQANAQTTGWELVEANDFVAARKVFESDLQRDPQNEKALVGMLFCTETVNEEERYIQHANQLMRSGWQPQYVWLFDHLFEGRPEELLKQPLPVPLRIPMLVAMADSLMRYRRMAESRAVYSAVIPDWNWSIVGPFDNMRGSGFVEPGQVEISGFDPQMVYENEKGNTFSWMNRRLREPAAAITFDQLPRHNDLATYYANTFLTVPTSRRVQLGIARNTPMKIWLDDQLLAELGRSFSPQEWDSETLTFDLPAGTHRLLIKLSEYPFEVEDSPISLEFSDSDSGSDPEMKAFDYYSSAYNNYSDRQSAAFYLRLTDPATGLLFSDATTDFQGNYTPASLAPPVDFQNRKYLNSFLEQAESGELWRMYLLAKAFLIADAKEEAEAFFATYKSAHPGSAFARYLLAKCFDANGKGERAEALLSEMDTLTTPTFAEFYNRFQKINKEQEEVKYVGALEQLLGISPANWNIMNTYLDFLKEKGRKEQVKTWVNDFLKYNNTEKWKKRLETYLKEESYKPESYKPQTDKQRQKAYKEAKKALKKEFSIQHYFRIIDYFKYKEQENDVLATYDEILATLPWATHFILEKASYLFEKERSSEALHLLTGLLKAEPYSPAVYELLGDIAIEQKNEPEALRRYRQAEKVSGESARYSGLRDKVEKLDNQKKYTGYFHSVPLAQAARDTTAMAQYADEEAVVLLFSSQNTFLRDEHKIESLRKAAIRILSEAGAKNWTEADLRQIGQINSAKVLKRDGSITSPELGYGMAVFKNLQAGDIILVEGTTEMSVSDEIAGDFWDMHIASWQAPVLRATTELLMPADMPLYFAANRIVATPTSQRDTGDFRLYRWEWQNIPKMESEEAAPETYDSYAWLMMGAMQDWSPVVRWYERQTYCRTEPNYEVLEKARQIIRPDMDEAEIVEALHTFIVREINYSYVPFLNNNYIPKKPGETISGKVGDCKDVATLMIALLREYDIPAWYTLVSTHSFSNKEMRPSIYAFNHAIIAYELKDKQLRFADLTTDYFPTGILPSGDSDAWGLIIREGETQVRRLPNHALDPEKSRIDIDATAMLDQEGNLQVDLRTVLLGTAAGHWRELLQRANAADRQKLLTEYFSGGVLTHLNLSGYECLNLDSINAPLHTRVQITAYNQLDRVSGLYIMPLPLPLSTPTQKTLFSAKRYNDLDLDALFELTPVQENVTLILPEGYQLAEMPANQQFDSPFGQYTLSFEKTAAGLHIQRRVQFKQRFVEHADFQELKKFYLRMLDADDLLLALKK
ncbi:MAG: DUF3857 domain-containing protein [Saprospiraceae bacterium]|nr:DUF3857 domain-containing protein [Saprospiraceae bacterium]